MAIAIQLCQINNNQLATFNSASGCIVRQMDTLVRGKKLILFRKVLIWIEADVYSTDEH